MPITRGNPQKNYKLINEFGLDYAEDVSDISDSTSGIFDDEIKGEAINILINCCSCSLTSKSLLLNKIQTVSNYHLMTFIYIK
jgi:hypothetical protein